MVDVQVGGHTEKMFDAWQVASLDGTEQGIDGEIIIVQLQIHKQNKNR